MLRLLRYRIRRFSRIDGRQRSLLLEACFWLLVSRLELLFMPFPTLARRWGRFVEPAAAASAATHANPTCEQRRLAEEISWAVTRAARHVPFRAVCLPQAMAAFIMLRKRNVGSVMHFGAAKGKEKPLDAHAWLDAAGVEVTGYPVGSEFAELGCFV